MGSSSQHPSNTFYVRAGIYSSRTHGVKRESAALALLPLCGMSHLVYQSVIRPEAVAEFKAAFGSVKGQVGRRGGEDGTGEGLNVCLEPGTGKAFT